MKTVLNVVSDKSGFNGTNILNRTYLYTQCNNCETTIWNSIYTAK